jgi:uncharacterized protein (DUF1778 family)
MAKTERLNIRVSEEQIDLLRRAAELSGQTVSDYVLSRVLADANDDLIDRRVFTLSAPQWKEFQALLNTPPQENPALQELLAAPRPWDQGVSEVAGEPEQEVATADVAVESAGGGKSAATLAVLKHLLAVMEGHAAARRSIALTLGPTGPHLWVEADQEQMEHWPGVDEDFIASFERLVETRQSDEGAASGVPSA